MNGYTPFGGIIEEASVSQSSPGVGDAAVRRNSYCFRPGYKPQSVAIPDLETLPDEIVELFTQAFIVGKHSPEARPTAFEWHDALINYEKQLVTCSENRLHQYDRKNDICPLCEADIRYKGAVNKELSNGTLKQKIYSLPLETPIIQPAKPNVQTTQPINPNVQTTRYQKASSSTRYQKAKFSSGNQSQSSATSTSTTASINTHKSSNTWYCNLCDEPNDENNVNCRSCGNYISSFQKQTLNSTIKSVQTLYCRICDNPTYNTNRLCSICINLKSTPNKKVQSQKIKSNKSNTGITAFIVATVTIVTIMIILGIISYYVTNRYYDWFQYTNDNNNVVFVSGENVLLSTVGNEPRYNRDNLYLTSSDYYVISFSQNGTNKWNITAYKPGTAIISLRSSFTDTIYTETWNSVGWQDLSDIQLFNGEYGNIFDYLQYGNLVNEQFNGDNQLMRNTLSKLIRITSSNNNIVSISSESGEISANRRGTATITIEQGEKVLKTFNIEVKNRVERLSVESTEIELELGESYQINASIYPSDADANITFNATSDLNVSTTGLISAPSYSHTHSGGAYYVTINAGELSERVEVRIKNSYSATWATQRNTIEVSGEGGWRVYPLIFSNAVPNCTGFTIGVNLTPPGEGTADLGARNLERDWRVFVRAEGTRWRNVGTIRIDSQNEWYYADISFSSRDLTRIQLLPPANYRGSGSFNSDIKISNLEYNGYIH
jgi:hypothetical protein